MAAGPDDEPADREADGDPANGPDDELQAGLPDREHPCNHGGDGDAVGDDARRVVDQALALQDRDNAAGDAEALGDRGRGDGVGGGDDRPEDEGRRPRKPGDGVDHGGDHEGRHQHQPYREE